MQNQHTKLSFLDVTIILLSKNILRERIVKYYQHKHTPVNQGELINWQVARSPGTWQYLHHDSK